MRRPLLSALRLSVLPTIAFAILLVALPDRRELTTHIWLLVVLTAALFAVLGAIRGTHPAATSLFDAPGGAGDERSGRFVSLARLEREISMATGSAYDVHIRLRPTLRSVAAGLLATRRGIHLDSTPARARAALGDETWELVRADRPAPVDGRAPGLELAALDRVVSSLERL